MKRYRQTRNAIVAAAAAMALGISIPLPALADIKTGPTVYCPSGTTVGAYSSTSTSETAPSYQTHRYTSTSGEVRTYSTFTAPSIHSSSSPFRNASTRWSSDRTIVNWSNRCD